jgi:glucosamine kinase
MRLAQHAIDGRARVGALAQAVSQQCGTTRHALLDWCAAAGQAEFAALAPLVFAHEADDPAAATLLQAAVQAVEQIIVTLDPTEQLPLVIAGSVGLRLMPQLRADLLARCVRAAGDACDGALHLLGVTPRAAPQSPAP